MQDQKQSGSDNKQYFDIKPFSNPSPTSRPVINNKPVIDDPMVSPARIGDDIEVVSSSKPEYDFVEENSVNNALNKVDDNVFADQQFSSSGAVTNNAVEPETPIAEPEVTTDPSSVNFAKSAAKEELETEKPVSAFAISQMENIPTEPINSNTTLTQTSITTESQANPVSDQSKADQPQPVQNSQNTESTPQDSVNLATEMPQNISPHIVSTNPKTLKDHFNLKTIIGIVILILIVVGALVVYKFKIGK